MGNTTVGGTLGVTGATTLSSADISGDTSIGGTLGTTGATTLGSSVSIAGNTTVGGTLGVTGATTLDGVVSANNHVTIVDGKSLTVQTDKLVVDTSGDTSIGRSLDVSGNTTLSGNAIVGGSFTAIGETKVGGAFTLGTKHIFNEKNVNLTASTPTNVLTLTFASDVATAKGALVKITYFAHWANRDMLYTGQLFVSPDGSCIKLENDATNFGHGDGSQDTIVSLAVDQGSGVVNVQLSPAASGEFSDGVFFYEIISDNLTSVS